MDTLRDFLLARILEDESLAQAAIDAHDMKHVWSVGAEVGGDEAHFARWNPWRVLTTCVAKRLLIGAHRDVGAGVDRRADTGRQVKTHACATCGQYDEYAIEWPCYTLRVLALDWVDHPAYRQEWRPRRLSSGVGRVPASLSGASAALPERTASAGPAASSTESPSRRLPPPQKGSGAA